MDLNFTPERVKKLRDRLGWTQTKLAEECGVTQGSVGHWEKPSDHKDHRTPTGSAVLQTLFRLEGRPAEVPA